MTEAGALFAAIGAVVAGGAGLLLVVRNARAKGRRAAIAEADSIEAELAECRERGVELRRQNFGLRETLADHGIKW